jgi:hypothetical protein
MINKSLEYQINWDGPFGWPGFERINNLPSLPDACGVYLETFPYKNGYIVYGAGHTGRFFKKRLGEWKRAYLDGKCNVLDIDAATINKKILRWKWRGLDATPIRNGKEKIDLTIDVCKQLACFRIFVARVTSERIRQRLEASINDYLDTSKYVIHDNIKAMSLVRRKSNEKIIIVKNYSKVRFYGIPSILEI